LAILPAHHHDKALWRHVADELKATARSGNTADVANALRLALMLAGVEHVTK